MFNCFEIRAVDEKASNRSGPRRAAELIKPQLSIGQCSAVALAIRVSGPEGSATEVSPDSSGRRVGACRPHVRERALEHLRHTLRDQKIVNWLRGYAALFCAMQQRETMWTWYFVNARI